MIVRTRKGWMRKGWKLGRATVIVRTRKGWKLGRATVIVRMRKGWDEF